MVTDVGTFFDTEVLPRLSWEQVFTDPSHVWKPDGKKCRGGCDILGPCPSTVLLFSSNQQRMDAAFCRALEEANTLWSAELVSTAAHEIAFAQAVGRHFPDPLNGIT